MNIYVHEYLAEVFLEREMFQTKFVEKIKIHFTLYNSPPPPKWGRLCDNVKKYGTDTGDNIIRHRDNARLQLQTHNV
jgi:hypothetical protein